MLSSSAPPTKVEMRRSTARARDVRRIFATEGVTLALVVVPVLLRRAVPETAASQAPPRGLAYEDGHDRRSEGAGVDAAAQL
jgi:hypothetical protein